MEDCPINIRSWEHMGKYAAPEALAGLRHHAGTGWDGWSKGPGGLWDKSIHQDES